MRVRVRVRVGVRARVRVRMRVRVRVRVRVCVTIGVCVRSTGGVRASVGVGTRVWARTSRTFCFAASNSSGLSTPASLSFTSLSSSSAVPFASKMVTTSSGAASGNSLGARLTWLGVEVGVGCRV